MHASTTQLLKVRDGEPVDAAVAAHVSECARCTAEVAKLAEVRDRLRGLPAPQANVASDEIKAVVWANVQHALRSAPRVSSSPSRYLAIAAAAVWAGVALIWFVFVDRDVPRTAPPAAIVQPVPMSLPVLETLVFQSQQLEIVLSDLPQRPRVERAATAATLDALEERIQWLDYALSSTAENGIPGEQAQMLWQERVQLLDSLVTLRYAQAERVHF